MRALILALLLVPPLAAQQTASGSISGGGAVSLSSAPAPLQPTPAMGYNTWLYPFDTVSNQGAGGSTAYLPTESFVHQQSDAMKATLGTYGYTLMSVDGGWGNRDSNGNIQAVPSQFPSGAAALGAYIHANGQKFGLYGTPATGCLSGYAEQYQHEYADAVAMVGWGVDYFKYDLCSGGNTFNTSAQIRAETNYLFQQFKGRPVSFLVNNYYGNSGTFAGNDSAQWYGAVGPNGASYLRIGSDNDAAGDPWYYKAFTQFDWSTFAPYQGIGRYLDPDNLMCQMKEGRPGNGSANIDTVSAAECQAQFNFYSIIAAPLVLAIPPSLVNAATLATITNTEVIAIDQDRLGIMGKRITAADVACGSSTCSVWVRKTANGYAVAFFNPDSSAHSVALTWSQAGLSGTFYMRDPLNHAELGSSSSGYTVSLAAGWGTAMVTLRTTQ